MFKLAQSSQQAPPNLMGEIYLQALDPRKEWSQVDEMKTYSRVIPSTLYQEGFSRAERLAWPTENIYAKSWL